MPVVALGRHRRSDRSKGVDGKISAARATQAKTAIDTGIDEACGYIAFGAS
jgi:hypothetical protein